MRHLRSLVFTLLGWFVVGTLVGSTSAAAHPRPCEHLAVLLYDVTGSFRGLLPRAVAHGEQIIRRLAPGDCLLVRTIGATSFPAGSVLAGRVPPRVRPIDVAFERRLLALKGRWGATLHGLLQMPTAPRTDLWGALHAAGQTLTATPARERLLVVYSDLVDNVRLKAPGAALRLDGARVLVFFVSRDPAPERFLARLRRWHQVLRGAGAREVRFHDVDLFPLEVSP